MKPSYCLFTCNLLISFLWANQLFAQSVGVNTTGSSPDASAMFDVESTNKGFLIPRVNLTDVNTFGLSGSSSTESIFLYNTNAAVTGGVGKGFYYWTGTVWSPLGNPTLNSLPNGQIWLGNASNLPTANNPNNAFVFENALTETGANTVRWGGSLMQNTTITGGNFNTTYSLSGTGSFSVVEEANPPSIFVAGNNSATNDGYVGIGTNSPQNRLHVVHGTATTASTPNTYPLAVGYTSSVANLTLGSDANFAYMQSWNSRPLLINSQGNNVGVNLTTTPVQALDVNGRMVVRNGVIQRGTTAINVTSDLGLYSQILGNWIRIASNAAPIKFFTDQGGGNSAGTNALVSFDNTNGGGVMIASQTDGSGNANAPNALAALEVSSTTKGVLFPRLTTAQRDAMTGTIPEGLHIFNTTSKCLEFFDTSFDPAGGPIGGFWNSYCYYCENSYAYNANSNGNDFNAQVGSPSKAQKWCVYVYSGITLGATTPGGIALNFANLPGGSSVILYNYGTIVGGGGNGGAGGQESDAVCAGDNAAAAGSAGGPAINTSPGVRVQVLNYGTIAGGGGGGGGGSGGCRSAGGGGGGGRGIPGGNGGNGWTTASGYRACGTFCTSCCGCPGSNPGGAGSAGAFGTGGCSLGNSGSGCTASGSNGGCGGDGGGYGAAGAGGTGTTCAGAPSASGGAGGNSLRGNGGSSSLTNYGSGVSFGTVIP